MFKRLLVVIVLLLLVFGGLFGIKYCQIQQMAGQSHMQPPSTVAVTTVEESEWQSYLESVGTLVATPGGVCIHRSRRTSPRYPVRIGSAG